MTSWDTTQRVRDTFAIGMADKRDLGIERISLSSKTLPFLRIDNHKL